MKTSLVLITIIMLKCVGFAQNKKLKLTPQDYGKWCEMNITSQSPDANWVVYNVKYVNIVDTLFVQNAKTVKKYNFPSMQQGKFSSDSNWFVAMDPKSELVLLNLNDGSEKRFANVLQYEFFMPKNLLIMRVKNGSSSTLNILDMKKLQSKIINDVIEFKVSVDGNIAIVKSNSVNVLLTERKYVEHLITSDTSGSYKRLTFSNSGKQLVFMQEMDPDKATSNHRLFNFNLVAQKLDVLDPAKSHKLISERISAPRDITPIFFSRNEEEVFFSRSYPNTQLNLKPNIEIWDSESKIEYNQLQSLGDLHYAAKLTKWNCKTGEITYLGTDNLPNVLLCDQQNYMVSYNRDTYQPQFKVVSPVDLYISNLKSGEQTLFLKKQETHNANFNLIASPSDNYIAYFKDDNWWLFDTNAKIHLKITQKLPTQFTAYGISSGMSQPFGSPGWSTDGNIFFFYERYDIYSFNSVTGEYLR